MHHLKTITRKPETAMSAVEFDGAVQAFGRLVSVIGNAVSLLITLLGFPVSAEHAIKGTKP